MSIGVVVGMIVLRPPLTRMYYVQLGALVAGAGLIVTLYNAFLTARARRRAERTAAQEPCADERMTITDGAPVRTAAVYEETQEAVLPAVMVSAPQRSETETRASSSADKSLDALLDTAYEAAENDPLHAVAAYREALR